MFQYSASQDGDLARYLVPDVSFARAPLKGVDAKPGLNWLLHRANGLAPPPNLLGTLVLRLKLYKYCIQCVVVAQVTAELHLYSIPLDQTCP